jgi:hypothetical protein
MKLMLPCNGADRGQLPRRESGPTSSWSFVTRQQQNHPQEENANEHGELHVCLFRREARLGPDRLAPA